MFLIVLFQSSSSFLFASTSSTLADYDPYRGCGNWEMHAKGCQQGKRL